ncbi:MAG TPA: hypothetical protein VFH29_04980, partial [Anaerolineales bacterium]|nr:hypothetical protein [Anaerolineales bacterium]
MAKSRIVSSRSLGLTLLVIVLARISLAALVYARPGLAMANDSDRYIPIAKALVDGTAYAWTTERPGELLNTI